MSRYLCIGMVMVMSTMAWAAHNVNGVIDSGEWSTVVTDSSSDNTPGHVEMLSCGAEVENDGSNDYLYWYCEISQNWTDFQGYAGGAKKIFPGLWIDADCSTATYLSDSSGTGNDNCADNDKMEWGNDTPVSGGVGNHRGIDINLELGLIGDWVNGSNTGPSGEGPGNSMYNYWGAGDDVAGVEAAVSSGSWYVSGQVMEARILLSELISTVEAMDDGVIVGDYLYVAIGVQGTNRTTIDYDYDVAVPLPVAVDPSTVDVLPGDVNLDKSVSSADYTLWANNYGGEAGWKNGDLNLDNAVTSADYTIWANNYGSTTSGGLVPEPTTMSLLGLGLFAALRRKK
ncbi:MAG: PEP-CTERM sorting domain-containing protein [Phycisphaerae bacterium]|nr:PEP-CTERM sorting domain-containing protein [Phycisphaerae bacterium]